MAAWSLASSSWESEVLRIFPPDPANSASTLLGIPQFVDQMIDRAGHLKLRILIEVLAQQRQRFAVKGHLHIRKPAGARNPELVMPVKRYGA
jgi:hypothetical protein